MILNGYWAVICGNCQSSSGFKKERADAIALWNARAVPIRTEGQSDYDAAYEIMEQMGFGFKVRNCSCGQLPCARLRPIADALAKREAEVRAGLPRATADGNAHKLTLPELNHLLALLESEKESGEYAGPREQYYARTERLMKWCQEQING
jgi:hypothetical protein